MKAPGYYKFVRLYKTRGAWDEKKLEAHFSLDFDEVRELRGQITTIRPQSRVRVRDQRDGEAEAMSRLTDLAAKATPRPWVNIPTASDAPCRTLIFMADNDEATAVFSGEEHRYDAELIVALVNNLDALIAERAEVERKTRMVEWLAHYHADWYEDERGPLDDLEQFTTNLIAAAEEAVK